MRFAVLVLLLVAAATTVLLTDAASPAAVRRAVEGSPTAAPLLYVGLYAALTVLLFPGAVASTAAGALFGVVWGTVLTLAGATLGATAAFLLARRLGREQVERMAGPRVATLDRWLTDRGLGAVVFLRLVPLFPFNAVNYGAGLTALPLGRYVAGTAIGIVPGTVAFVGLGAGLGDGGGPALFASIGLLAALTAAGLVVLRFSRP